VFSHFGWPKVVQSDGDATNITAVIRTMIADHGAEHRSISADDVGDDDDHDDVRLRLRLRLLLLGGLHAPSAGFDAYLRYASQPQQSCNGDDGDYDDGDDDDDAPLPPVAEPSGADGLERRLRPIAPLVVSSEWGGSQCDGEAQAVAGWAPRPHSRLRRVPVERVSAPAHCCCWVGSTPPQQASTCSCGTRLSPSVLDSLKPCIKPQ
jgi:hypothetical protein